MAIKLSWHASALVVDVVPMLDIANPVVLASIAVPAYYLPDISFP